MTRMTFATGSRNFVRTDLHFFKTGRSSEVRYYFCREVIESVRNVNITYLCVLVMVFYKSFKSDSGKIWSSMLLRSKWSFNITRTSWNTRAVISLRNFKIRNLTRTIFTKSLMSQSTIYFPWFSFLLHDMKFDILLSSNFLVPFNSYMHQVFDEYKKNLFDFLTLSISRVITESKWFWFRVQSEVLRD